MNYDTVFELVKSLPFDIPKVTFSIGTTQIFILRPEKLGKRFQNYDNTKNFQIWLKEGEREFRPNHLRVMIDLNLRVRSRPDLREKLLLAFDNIYYKLDPEQEMKELVLERFEHFLNPLLIIAHLDQLFIIEQNYCYNKLSKYDPPTLFYQGWIRQMIDSPKEIDNLCMSVCNRQPPQALYTNKENAKHKEYTNKLNKLWYLEKWR